jgi:hypothetical protein
MDNFKNAAAINLAGKDLYAMFLGRMQKDKGVHVGTLVSAAARLAGSSLLRSFKFMQKPQTGSPGSVLLSYEADKEWPKLMGVVFTTLKSNKIEIDPNRMAIHPPAEHAPLAGLLQMQTEYQTAYFEITDRHYLNFEQAALAGATACALVIVQSHTFVDPQITCGIAAMGFVEGCKTVPAPIKKTN